MEAHQLDGRSTVGAMQIDKSHFTVKRVCRVVPELVCTYCTPSAPPFCFQRALLNSLIEPANASSLISSDWVVWLCSCTRTACGWQTTLARRCGVLDSPQAYLFVLLQIASGHPLSGASPVQGGNRAVLRAQIQQTFKKNAGETDPKKVCKKAIS